MAGSCSRSRSRRSGSASAAGPRSSSASSAATARTTLSTCATRCTASVALQRAWTSCLPKYPEFMARIDQILEETRPCFSFEFFPPKTEEGEKNLREALAELRKDAPSFVSVTYGAGGSTRDRTIEIVKWIKKDLGIEAMAHFTCVGATVEALRTTLDDIRGAGIDNVLALRGDPPQGQTEWTKTEGGLEYSTQLIDLIRG